MSLQQLADSSPTDSYVRQLLEQLQKRNIDWAARQVKQTKRTKAVWHTRHSKGDVKFSEIDDFLTTQEETVVVVEDIDLPWMVQIGRCWKVSASFFAEHAVNAAYAASDPFEAILRPDEVKNFIRPAPELVEGLDPAWSEAHVWHLDGCFTPSRYEDGERVLEPHFIERQNSVVAGHRANYSTRISWWDARLGDVKSSQKKLILILVDPPYTLRPSENKSLAELHVPISRNRGGLAIPQLFSQPSHSLLDCLQGFLSHSWYFGVIFASRRRVAPVGPDSLAYMLTASVWETNLRFADKEIKRISFSELREPSTKINNQLHDWRRDLDYLQVCVRMAKDWLAEPAERPLAYLKKEFAVSMILPSEAFDDIEKRASELQRFLMDTFTLLLSSISVREAELGVKQSLRAQQLTTLAFIYVPLSFVTGIFGMNVSEFNDSYLSVWVPAVTLGGTILVTALLFGGYITWQRRKRKLKRI